MLLGCGGDESSGKAACGAFAACGGNLDGTWVIDGNCAEADLEAYMMAQSDLPAECSAAFKNVTMDVAGTITYAAGTETSDTTVTTHVNSVYTAECISAMAGQKITSLSQVACDAAEQGAVQNGGTATCTLVGSACDCNITSVQTVQETETYTVSGNAVAYSDGSSMEYCVSGSNLSARGEAEPGLYMQYYAHR